MKKGDKARSKQDRSVVYTVWTVNGKKREGRPIELRRKMTNSNRAVIVTFVSKDEFNQWLELV